MTNSNAIRLLLCAMACLSLAACGGGASATLGGTLSGLGTGLSLVLQNNDSDDLTLTANGSFAFATGASSGDTYDVSVLTQPVGQTCSVTSGSGTVDSADDSVDTIAVTCSMTSSLGGTVSGLAAGTSVTLRNGNVTLAVASNGAFAFPGILTAGTAYSVGVAVQPAGLTCSVSGASGAVVANVMASVSVTCS